jgi:hypothetical protein
MTITDRTPSLDENTPYPGWRDDPGIPRFGTGENDLDEITDLDVFADEVASELTVLCATRADLDAAERVTTSTRYL